MSAILALPRTNSLPVEPDKLVVVVAMEETGPQTLQAQHQGILLLLLLRPWVPEAVVVTLLLVVVCLVPRREVARVLPVTGEWLGVQGVTTLC